MPLPAFAQSFTATGRLEPVESVTLGSYVSGIVEEVTCDFNMDVRKGQSCARIDQRRFVKAMDQAKAAHEAAQAQLALHNAALLQAKTTFDRNTTLLERGVVAKSVFDGIKSNYDQLRAQIDLDAANITLRKAEVDAAELNLIYTNITSPIDGVVIARKITAGETVAANFQTPVLFVVASTLRRLHLTASVGESDVGGLVVGNSATFSAKAFPKKTFPAKIVQIRNDAETLKEGVRYNVILAVDNEDLLLKPGMTVSVNFTKSDR